MKDELATKASLSRIKKKKRGGTKKYYESIIHTNLYKLRVQNIMISGHNNMMMKVKMGTSQELVGLLSLMVSFVELAMHKCNLT